MERFNIRCPDHFPMKCNLSPADKDYLLTGEKYKAFFIFQYKEQDEWLSPAIETYFNERTWRLFNAGKEGGTGTKFCNVCRYALSSDFGIVSLTPLNYNVFQEIGLMQGIQKQLLYTVNPARLKETPLPFDMGDQIYIEHKDKSSLIAGLDKKIPLILDKVQLLSGVESERRKSIKIKLEKLSPDAKEILKALVLEGPRKFLGDINDDIVRLSREYPHLKMDTLKELSLQGFILVDISSAGSRSVRNTTLNESYRRYLEDLLWED